MKFLLHHSGRFALHAQFKYAIIGVLVLIVGFTACQKETTTGSPKNSIDPKLLAAVERLGLNSNGAFLDHSGNLIVEGDIALSISELRLQDAGNESENRQRVVGQHCVRSYIATGTTLKYHISDDFDDLWKAAIQAGVAAWETDRNNCFFEAVSSAAEADILFLRNDEIISNLYGVANFPCENHGREIQLYVPELEADHGDTPLFDCIRNVATHEFGHALGFSHTDSFAELLNGTPASDPNSIMLSGTAWPAAPLGLPWFGMLPGPDAEDRKMAEYLFPRDGAHLDIGLISATKGLDGKYAIRVKFQHSIAFCYNIDYELKSGETILVSGNFLTDGLENGTLDVPGTYPSDRYTVTFCGKNYAQDYNSECSRKTSKSFDIPYYPPLLEDK